jgi:hypothetical protein
VIKIKDSKLNTTMINANANNVVFESEYSQEEIELMLNNIIDNKNDITIKMVDGLGFSDNYKVRISAPQLTRDFELFPVFKDDFMSTVANFHMPCVRAYYNGETVYMTPSFVSAHMTFMNIDYKYFAGSKDPLNIINKYRMRGFGTWLNKNEIETYIKYTYAISFWNSMFKIDPGHKHTYYKCLGPLKLNHNLFKPRRFCAGFLCNYPPIPTINPYNEHVDEEEEELREHTSIDDLVFIDENTGYIQPLKSNIIEQIFMNYPLELYNDIDTE